MHWEQVASDQPGDLQADGIGSYVNGSKGRHGGSETVYNLAVQVGLRFFDRLMI
jgi:hypothetical protein